MGNNYFLQLNRLLDTAAREVNLLYKRDAPDFWERERSVIGSGNILCYEIRTALYKEFITDIDREDIFRIMLALNRLIDELRDLRAESNGLDLIKRAIVELRNALGSLRDRRTDRLETAISKIDKIDENAEKYGDCTTIINKIKSTVELVTEIFIKNC